MKAFFLPGDLIADEVLLHLIEIYFEEISAIYDALNENQLLPLIEPIFFVYLKNNANFRLSPKDRKKALHSP